MDIHIGIQVLESIVFGLVVVKPAETYILCVFALLP